MRCAQGGETWKLKNEREINALSCCHDFRDVPGAHDSQNSNATIDYCTFSLGLQPPCRNGTLPGPSVFLKYYSNNNNNNKPNCLSLKKRQHERERGALVSPQNK